MTQIPISEAGRIILNTFKDELFPIQKNIRELLVDVQKCKIYFPIYSKKLNMLKKRYSGIATNFFTLSQKLETPDILFKDIKEDPQNIVEYMNYQNVISNNINEGVKYIEILDRTLDRKNQDIQNFRTLILALIAIIISLWN